MSSELDISRPCRELFDLLQRSPQPPGSFSEATTLKAAVRDRAVGSAEVLIERGVDPEDLQRALVAAAFDRDMLPLVLGAADRQGARLDLRPALEGAMRFAEPEVIELLRSHASPSDLEGLDDIQPVRYLERTQWFHGPAKQKAIRRMSRLIRSGVIDRCLETPLDSGLSPLLEAARRGLDRIVEELLARGAEADACDPQGWTALMMAAELGREPMISSLLRAGADPNRRSPEGETALMVGVNDPAVVRRLLAAGADVLAVTEGGRSAYTVVGGVFREEIRRMLSEAEPAGRGRGLRWISHPLEERRGSWDFLKQLGDCPWSVIFVEAPIEKVTANYAELRDPVRIEPDMADRDMGPVKEWAYLVQLRGDPWTVVLRTLGRWHWGDRFRTGQEAMELSTFLSCRTLATTFNGQNDHNGPAEMQKCTYEIYHDGELREERRWHKNGDLLFFRPIDGPAPESFGTSWEDLHLFFKQQGVFLPPAESKVEGSRLYLDLYGLKRSDLKRADLLVFEEIS